MALIQAPNNAGEGQLIKNILKKYSGLDENAPEVVLLYSLVVIYR